MSKIIKIILGIVVLAVIVVLVAVFLRRGLSEEKIYKIGAIIPLTGGGATLGTPMINGMALAVEEINDKGGINGYKLKLIPQDSKLEGKTSVDAANYLLNVENPDIFTVLFHLPAQAVSPILKEAKKPLVYEAFTRSPMKDSSYTFKANFDSLTGCEKLIRYAKNNNKYKKLGVLMSKVEYNELCLEGIKKVESDVKEYWYNFGDKDFRTLFSKAKNDGVDVLVTIGIDFEYINIFKQLTELGYPIKMMCAIASECIFPDVIESASPNILDGTLSIDFISPDIDETEFGQKYRDKHLNPSFTDYVYGAVGYEEVMYITEAMKHCNAGDSKCLVKELEKLGGYKTVINSNGFKDRILQLTTEIYEWKNSEWKILK